jgi:hypothetical protein
MSVKVTDISSNLTHLLGPDGGKWGFLYSACIPQQQQQSETPLQKSGLSQHQLGQVGISHARQPGPSSVASY